VASLSNPNEKLEAAHHRWQRSILGMSWKDKVTNEKIREATALPKLEDIIRCRRLRWLGHLSQMDHHRLPRQALIWEPEGFRRRQVDRDRTGKMSSRKISGKWASAGTRLKRLWRTGGTGGIVSPNASLMRDEPGTKCTFPPPKKKYVILYHIS